MATENATAKPLIRRIFGGDAAITQLVIITILIFVAMTALSPDKFLRYYNFESISYIMPELGILSIAMMVTMLTGGIDLSVVGVANLAAICAGLYFKVPFVAEGLAAGGMVMILHTLMAVLIALMVGLIAGAVNGVLITQFRIIPILATLGTGQAFAGLALVLTGGPAIVGFPETWSWIGNGKILWLATPLWVLAGVAVAVSTLLRRTSLGVSLMLIGTNAKAAVFAGIRSNRMMFLSYVMAGLMAAIAGILLSGRTNAAKADFGDSYLLQAVLIAVLGGTDPAGGRGRVLGIILAVTALMLLSSGFQMVRVSNHMIDFIWGAFLVLVIAINYLRRKR